MADRVKVSAMENKSKFIHSIKPPRAYKEASKILKKVSQMESSFKNCFYNTRTHDNQKKVYALVTKTMKYSSILDELIDSSSLSKEPRLDKELAKVLMYELLFGKKSLPGNSKPVLKILETKKELETGLKRVLKKNQVTSMDAIPVRASLPIYMRINTLKTSVEEFISYLEGYDTYETKYDSETTYEEFLKLVKSLEIGTFIRDFHVPNLLVFPFGSNYAACSFYTESKIKQQDKGSCLPAMLLNPTPGSTVIDACAAPGMKTTQLAALMENKGQILAVEMNEKRMELLKSNLTASGVACATTLCEDFTTLNPTEEPQWHAEYILVDPSCSGSGMATRLTEGAATTTNNSDNRLRGLSCFQAKCLNHALTFPNVKRVVYSTCSLSTEENEAVISQTLAEFKGKFRLVKALPGWPRRGKKEGFKNLSRAIRTEPELDLTGGFFIAVIERCEAE